MSELTPPPPPFFIVGCPRSGTGLLRDLLRSHPNLAIPPESHFIPSYFKAFGNPSGPGAARRLGRRILSVPHVALWGLDVPEDAFDGCACFSEIVEVVHRAWAEREGKPRWGDKTPQYVEHLRLLSDLFPRARFVHLIRDGRDVTLSWLRTHFEPENTFTAATFWARMVGAGREAGQSLGPDRYLEVRYEDLVSNPEPELRRVLDHLGERFQPEVLKPSRLLPTWPIRDHLVRRPDSASRDRVVATSVARWRTAMSRKDRILVESAAGAVLEELRYPVEGLARSVGVPERVGWRIHHYVRYVYYRLRGRTLRRSFVLRGAATLGGAALLVRARSLANRL